MNGDDTKRLFEAIGRIEANQKNMSENLERHRQETREDVRTLHQRIDRMRDETKAALARQAERISTINSRHAEEDGSARTRGAIRLGAVGVGAGAFTVLATKLVDWLGK